MKIIVIFLLLCRFVKAVELAPDEIQAQQEGLQKWTRIVDGVNEMEPEAAIEKLGEGVRKTSNRRIYSIDGTNEVAAKLKSAMIAIPGHAAYYRDRILQAQYAVKHPETTTASGSLNDYWNEQHYGIQTLRQLPSAETVQVLGEFLSNNWLPDVDPRSFPIGRLDHRAVLSLSELPLLDKPANTQRKAEEVVRDLRTWQLWYEQIKAGTRTFRFEGDPNEYTLHGPLTAEERKRRDQENQRRAGVKPAGQEPVTAKEGIATKPLPVIGLIASCLFCAAAVWYFLRGRK